MHQCADGFVEACMPGMTRIASVGRGSERAATVEVGYEWARMEGEAGQVPDEAAATNEAICEARQWIAGS